MKRNIEKGEEYDWVTPFSYLPRSAEYFFDNDLENYPVSEGDIITIKTLNEDDGSTNFYFFTFLIELDPL